MIATYANCGHGIQGKMDPIIANIHNMIHIIHHNIVMMICCIKRGSFYDNVCMKNNIKNKADFLCFLKLLFSGFCC